MKEQNEDSINFEIWARARGNAARANLVIPKTSSNQPENVSDELRQRDGQTSVEPEEKTGNLLVKNRNFSGDSEANK